MGTYFTYLKVLVASCGGYLTYLLGGYDLILKTMIMLTIFDMVTGVVNGIYNQKLDSHICSKGIVKKVYIYITIGFAVVIDNWLNNAIPLREVVLTFYIVNEGLSVLENIGKVIDYPEQLKQVFEQLRDGDE